MLHVEFEEMFLEQAVGIKAWEGLQSICNKKIRRIPYSQVYPDLIVAGKYRLFYFSSMCIRKYTCVFSPEDEN